MTEAAGPDPVAVDTVCEAIMEWENPGSVPSTRLAAAQGVGTNRLDEIEVARPVLRRSQCFWESELVKIVETRTEEHRLVIAGR